MRKLTNLSVVFWLSIHNTYNRLILREENAQVFPPQMTCVISKPILPPAFVRNEHKSTRGRNLGTLLP